MKYILLLFIPLLLFGQKQRRCPGSAYTDSYTKIEARNGWQADIGDSLGQSIIIAAYNASIGDKYLAKYICDGVNDEVQIQQAIDFLSTGGSLELTNGDFILSPSTTTSEIITIKNNIKIKAMGNSSILKVKANAGNYKSILGATSKLSNFTCDGVVFDHNADNNDLGSDAAYTASGSGRYSVVSMVGWEDLTLINNKIINFDGIVSFYFTRGVLTAEADARDIIVDNNKFLDVGQNARGIVYDVSVINITGSNALITNNMFTRNDWTIGSPYTAIELSVSNSIVANNIIRRFHVGMNITEMWRYTDVEQTIISTNSIDVSRDGIILWCETYETHKIGYGMNGMLIVNNTIRIRPKEHKVIEPIYAYWGGIRFFGIGSVDTLMDAKNIKITSNLIIIDADTSGEYASVNGNNGAIGWYLSTGNENILYENIEISQNTIIGSPQPGVACKYGKIKGLTIKNNEFINCGTSMNPAAISTRKVVIELAPDSILSDIIIKDNIIRDTNDSGIVNYVYYLKSNSNSTNKIKVINDVYDIKDISNLVSTIYVHPSEYFDLYLDIKKAPDIDRLTWYRIVKGSFISVDSIEYKAFKDGSGAGNVWHAHSKWNAAPTALTWYVGDMRTNTEISLGENLGWMCRSNGTPGNWGPYGQLGRRTNAGTPAGAITPYFIGEELFDSSNSKWYKSTGLANTNWSQISN